MYKATLQKEVVVKAPNEKGVAAKISNLISKQAKTNIRTGWAVGVDGQGYFGLLTDNNKKAVDTLKGEFPETKESEVLFIYTEDSLGEIAQITETLSNAGINIHFLQATYVEGKPVIIVDTDNNKKALGLFS